MAIEKRLRKNGASYYINTDTKRFAQRKDFVRSNIEKIRNSTIDYKSLNKKEKLSYTRYNRVTYKGKLISRDFDRIVRKEAKKANIDINKGAELQNYFGGVNPIEILKDYQEKIFIEQDKINTKTGDIFNIQSNIAERLKKGEQVVVFDKKGKKHFGFNAINAINDFESKERNRLKGSKNVIFLYQQSIDFDSDLKIIFSIDLRDVILIES